LPFQQLEKVRNQRISKSEAGIRKRGLGFFCVFGQTNSFAGCRGFINNEEVFHMNGGQVALGQCVSEVKMQGRVRSRNLAVSVPVEVRKPGEIGIAVVGIVLGLLGYYFALDMTSDSYSAPSVFPKISSIIIAACGIICLVKALQKERAPIKETLLTTLLPKDVLVMLSMLVAYCVALPWLHFIASSFVFMVAGMVYLQRGKRIVQSIAISTLSLTALVVVFRYAFMVMLP
jgi:hypothetical protein